MINKTTTFIKNNKALVLIVLAGAIILIALLIALLTTNSETPEDSNQPTATEIPLSNLETDLPYRVNNSLLLTEINPEPPVFKSIWATEALQLTFNQPTSARDVVISIIPKIEFIATDSTYKINTINIAPITGWKANEDYVITINSELNETPLRFRIRREEPVPGDPEYPDEDDHPEVGI